MVLSEHIPVSFFHRLLRLPDDLSTSLWRAVLSCGFGDGDMVGEISNDRVRPIASMDVVGHACLACGI
jgi:hypothetical protein